MRLHRYPARAPGNEPGQFGGYHRRTRPKVRTLTVEISEDTASYLSVLDEDGDVERVIQHLIHSAADGVRRPGSWERGWLASAFASDFEDRCVPVDHYQERALSRVELRASKALDTLVKAGRCDCTSPVPWQCPGCCRAFCDCMRWSDEDQVCVDCHLDGERTRDGYTSRRFLSRMRGDCLAVWPPVVEVRP